jgi:hypothetical protein
MAADRPGLGHNGGPALDEVLSATVREACKISRFSRDAIYNLINTGEIRSFLLGSRRFIDVPSLREYIRRRAAEPLQHARRPNLTPLYKREN